MKVKEKRREDFMLILQSDSIYLSFGLATNFLTVYNLQIMRRGHEIVQISFPL